MVTSSAFRTLSWALAFLLNTAIYFLIIYTVVEHHFWFAMLAGASTMILGTLSYLIIFDSVRIDVDTTSCWAVDTLFGSSKVHILTSGSYVCISKFLRPKLLSKAEDKDATDGEEA